MSILFWKNDNFVYLGHRILHRHATWYLLSQFSGGGMEHLEWGASEKIGWTSTTAERLCHFEKNVGRKTDERHLLSINLGKQPVGFNFLSWLFETLNKTTIFPEGRLILKGSKLAQYILLKYAGMGFLLANPNKSRSRFLSVEILAACTISKSLGYWSMYVPINCKAHTYYYWGEFKCMCAVCYCSNIKIDAFASSSQSFIRLYA